VLKRPCTFSVRVANEPVKGTPEQLYTNLQREIHTFVSRAGAREKIRSSNVLSFLARRAPDENSWRAILHITTDQRTNETMAERPVLVGLIPQTVVLDDGDQVSWISDAGNLRVEFDVNRCPFSSNVFQAPAGMRLLSGPARPGIKAATYKYRLWLNDQMVGHGEVILRDK
jgi:hypothetical protein